MILSQSNYAVVDNRLLKIPQGAFLPQEGYVSETTIQVLPYPAYHARPDRVHNALVRLMERVYSVFLTTLKALKDALGDINATTDFMKLLVNGTKLAQDTFDIPSLQAISKGFAPIIEFIYGRAIFSRTYDILSGDAALKEPLFGRCNFLRVMNKLFMLGNDSINFLKWFSNIGLIEKFVECEVGTFPVCGPAIEKSVKLVFGEATKMTVGRLPLLCFIFGSVPSLIDELRLIVKYATAKNMLEQERKSKIVGYTFDCISDICRIAFSILFLLPPGLAFYGIVAQGIGSCASLSKFYYNEHTKAALEKEKTVHMEKRAAAKALCEQYVQVALRDFGRPYLVDFPSQAEAAVEGVFKGMDENERPFMQSLNAKLLAREVLNRAEVRDDAMVQELMHRAIEQWNACNAPAVQA